MSTNDTVALIGAVASAVAVILGAIGALWVKIHGVEMSVNGRMTELLELTRSSSRAEGALGAAPSAGSAAAEATGTPLPPL